MSVAGAAGSTFLTPAAERLLHRRSRGVPRRINQLCDRALLAACVRNAARVEPEDVARAAASLSDGSKRAGWTAWPWRWFRLGRGGAA